MSELPPPYSAIGNEKSGFADPSAPPAGGQPYPPMGTAYPPAGTGYPPAGTGYPPAGGSSYPQAQPAGGYPPQNPGPYPTQPAGQYIPQPGVVVTTAPCMRMGERPVNMRCPHCQAEIVSGTTYETGGMVYVIAGVMCFFGCWLGCCLLPFCMDGCKDVVHHCPNCNKQVGRFNRL